jgi:DNA-binding Lrp family transcriptional regulator
MLAKLFGSNARVKILKLFLLHSEEKYYIRQISRNLGLQINSVRRELENLEKFGLLKSFTAKSSDNKEEEITDKVETKKTTVTKKKIKVLDAASGQEKKYFQVNKDFILFEEIKSVIVKSQMLYERDFVKKIEELGKMNLFILTGFFTNAESSPVDLFIVGKLNKGKLIDIIKTLEKDMGRELNYTIMDYKEYLFRRDMTDVFLYNVLESDKIVIVDNIGMS